MKSVKSNVVSHTKEQDLKLMLQNIESSIEKGDNSIENLDSAKNLLKSVEDFSFEPEKPESDPAPRLESFNKFMIKHNNVMKQVSQFLERKSKVLNR